MIYTYIYIYNIINVCVSMFDLTFLWGQEVPQDLWKKVIETHVNEEKEEVLEEAKLEAEPGPSPRC